MAIEVLEGIVDQWAWNNATPPVLEYVAGALSVTNVETLDLICEGEIDGLMTASYKGVYEGAPGRIGWDSVVITPHSDPPGLAGQNKNYLKSIFWNEVPVVSTANTYNFQRIDTSFTPGLPNGSLIDATRPKLSITRAINERLRHTVVNPNGEPIPIVDASQASSTNITQRDDIKYYAIYNKECIGVYVNIKIASLGKSLSDVDKKHVGSTLPLIVDWQIYFKPVFTDPEDNKHTNYWILGKKERAQGMIRNGYIKSTHVDFLWSYGNQASVNTGGVQNYIDVRNRPTFYGWMIKIVRSTNDGNLDNKTVESNFAHERSVLLVDSITEIYDEKYIYPNCAIVRSQFSAEFFAQIPNRAFLTRLLKIKIPSNYDPITKQYAGDWDGTFAHTKQWSDNPAWCFYDLVSNSRYGLGKYINEHSLDKWSLYEIGRYCDTIVADGFGYFEPRFTCNLYITSREEAYKVINDLASVFRAITYYAAGSIFVVQDSPKLPIVQFTNANVEEGNFQYSSSGKKARHTVAVVRYNDKNNFFKPAIEYAEDTEGIKRYGIRELEVAAFGCTSRGQAVRLGRWAILSETLETEFVTFTAGLEGAYLRPGDIFQVFDANRKLKRYGGRVFKAGFFTSSAVITLDDEIIPNLSDAATAANVYKFNLLTPSYNYDPTQVDLAGSDYPNIRKNFVQTQNFLGSDTVTVNGKTVITFDYAGDGFNTVDYNVEGNPVWTIEQVGAGNTYTNVSNFLDTDYDAYRVINIKEKEGFKYEIGGLTYAGSLEPINGNPPPSPLTTYTLTVTSTPYNEVDIEVYNADNNNLQSAKTPFTRLYNAGAVITLRNTAAFEHPFIQWNQDDAFHTNDITASVTMNSNHLLVAIFSPPVTVTTYTLTVTMALGAGGPLVPTDFGVTPIDVNGFGDATDILTSFTRTYNVGEVVKLNSPAEGSHHISDWTENSISIPGIEGESGFISITMNADHSIIAIFNYS